MGKNISQQALEMISARFAEQHQVVPIEVRDNTLVVAHPHEIDPEVLQNLEMLLEMDVTFEALDAIEIQALIREHYGLGARAIESLMQSDVANSPAKQELVQVLSTESLSEAAEEAAIVGFVNGLIRQAHSEGATDIHLEPFENQLHVRSRIDGLLHDVSVPKDVHRFHAAIVSRIKVMAHLDIAEHRLPQDGRIRARVDAHDLDMRVSILPTPHGEAVDIRVLADTEMLHDLQKLGLESNELAEVRRVLHKPHGVVLVTGPTGSGKTTTLYSFLHELNDRHRKIITIEDPIEYKMDGITQIQVKPQIGLTFGEGLRAMLRHDPDIMMVGEVRDQETAETMIRVAMTGHLVFSTIHTNDAPSTMNRLVNMGVEPYLAASSIECILAERLIRLLCDCSVADERNPSAQSLGLESHHLEEIQRHGNRLWRKAVGCDKCRHTGYKGRRGIFEVLVPDDEMREAMINGVSAAELQRLAERRGYRPLRAQAVSLAMAGLTSLEEAMRITNSTIHE